MNAYEEKQEARKEYYRLKAEQAKDSALAASKRADDISRHIPPGQPILVGHHSEGRHRRDLARINSAIQQSVDALDKADYYIQKADGVGQAGISGDDPDAVDKLKEKLARLEALQDYMKKINRVHIAYLKNPKALDEYDLTDEDINRVVNYKHNYSWEPHPFAPCQLTNNNANIKRIKDRIKKLESRSKLETQEIVKDDVRIVQNVEANRFQIFFPGKPDQETRSQLKSAGFRWTPSLGCWQAYMNNRALYNIKKMFHL